MSSCRRPTGLTIYPQLWQKANTSFQIPHARRRKSGCVRRPRPTHERLPEVPRGRSWACATLNLFETASIATRQHRTHANAANACPGYAISAVLPTACGECLFDSFQGCGQVARQGRQAREVSCVSPRRFQGHERALTASTCRYATRIDITAPIAQSFIDLRKPRLNSGLRTFSRLMVASVTAITAATQAAGNLLSIAPKLASNGEP